MKDLIGLILAVLILFGGCGKDASNAQEKEPECAFTYHETKVEMHAEAAPILEALGQPVSYTEETSCAFEGLDKTYFYGSFYLATYPDGDADKVHSLWFADDTVATDEGIRIGDSTEAVRKAYGSEAFDGSNYVVTGGNSKMMIGITNGNVSSIVYEALI